MNDRFKILDDRDFWTSLMFKLSGCFSESEDKDLNSLWIDGFDPINCSNTKTGIDVEGVVWVMVGQKEVHEFRFTMALPQNLLHKKIGKFKFEILLLDFNEKKLELRIEK